MPFKASAPAQIFEDPEEAPKSPRKSHKRVPSVGDVLRGRRIKPNDGMVADQQTAQNCHPATQNPLGERNLNSPPQSRRIPIKDHDGRPTMHKKSNSSVSLKGFLKSKEKADEHDGLASADGKEQRRKPEKTKSSTSLSGLLRKRSKKDLKSDTEVKNENVAPVPAPTPAATPIWAQFATQPITSPGGKIQYPESPTRHIDQEIQPYAPRDYFDIPSAGDRLQNVEDIAREAPAPPQRPFLEHKSSRSSIFKEEMDDNSAITPPDLQILGQCSPSQPIFLPSKNERPPLHSQASQTSQVASPLKTEAKAKRSSRVLDAVSTLSLRSRKEQPPTPGQAAQSASPLSPREVDSAFEKILDSLNIPQNMRDNVRNLTADVKVGLMKGDRVGSGSSTCSIAVDAVEVRSSARNLTRDQPFSQESDEKEGKRSRSRSRPRSRILTLGKRDAGSPTKTDSSVRSRSKSRPRSIDTTNSSSRLPFSASTTSLVTPDSAATPGDFTHYLREVQKPALVEVGKLHKLRLLLRNESVTWTDAFVSKGGMDELVQLLYRIQKVEWREEHEDALLHETLLCLKALCTTSLALQHLSKMAETFFPAILGMLFDEERKGPSEFATRAVITSLLFAHLSAVQGASLEEKQKRAAEVLSFLRDPRPLEDKQPLGFISQMHVSRPYRMWHKEVSNVTKEVFWIFLHHMNVVPITHTAHTGAADLAQAHFPAPRPPHPAAPYVGGVEWEATQYLAVHMDLMNGVLAFTPSRAERNALREDLRQSGWEKVMGGSLRTCKEKFYGSVHDGLKCWVAAATTDGWPVEDVRAGPPRETVSPRKSPTKQKQKTEEAPKLALDVEIGGISRMEDAWV